MKERFWNVDLSLTFRLWLEQLWIFFMTLLTFVGLAMPVIIPTLILWYLASIDWKMTP